MKLMTTSVTALAAFGILAGAGLSASACEFGKGVTAAVTPPAVSEDVTASAPTVDPMLLADASKAMLVPVAPMGVVYSAAAVLLGGWFVWRALRLWRGTSPAESMRLFRFSIVYLALLFAAVAADAAIVG